MFCWLKEILLTTFGLYDRNFRIYVHIHDHAVRVILLMREMGIATKHIRLFPVGLEVLKNIYDLIINESHICNKSRSIITFLLVLNI